jgi:hypothetical protein
VIVELSGGRQAEIRDKLQGGDFRLAREAMKFHYAEDGSREFDGSFELKVKCALITRLVTHWDVPGAPPRPQDAVDPMFVLDSLDEDDYTALMEAVQPAYDKVMESSQKKTPTSSSDSPTSS